MARGLPEKGPLLALFIALACARSAAAALPYVTKIGPTYGPRTGGTVLTVTGTGFVEAARSAAARADGSKPVCVFDPDHLIYQMDTIVVPATIVSDTKATCETPLILCEGQTYVAISLDGGTTYDRGNVMFNFFEYFSFASRMLPYQTDAAQGELVGQVSPHVLDGVDLRSQGGAAAVHVVAVCAETGAQLLDEPIAADGNVHTLPFSFASFGSKTGTFTVQATLFAPRSGGGAPQALNRTEPLLRVAYKPITVQVDRYTRGQVVGGVPFLQTGWFIPSGSNPDDSIDKVRSMGIRGLNAAMDYSTPNMAAADRLRFLDAAAEVGVHVQIGLLDLTEVIVKGSEPVHSSAYSAQWATIKEVVTQVMDHPAVHGWYITDDTIGQNTSRIADVYDWFKAADPWHPVTNTFAGSGNAWAYILPRRGYDVTQYEAYDASDPDYQVLTIGMTYPMNFVPGLICGQGFTGPHQTLLSIPIQTFITAMYGGTGGIMWWEMWPGSRGSYSLLYESSLQVSAKVRYLAPALTAATQQNRMPDAGTDVVSSTLQVGAVAFREGGAASGCVRILVANLEQPPTAFNLSGTLFMTTTATTANVMYEDRTVPIVNGGIGEYIESFGVHVYAVGCEAIDTEPGTAASIWASREHVRPGLAPRTDAQVARARRAMRAAALVRRAAAEAHRQGPACAGADAETIREAVLAIRDDAASRGVVSGRSAVSASRSAHALSFARRRRVQDVVPLVCGPRGAEYYEAVMAEAAAAVAAIAAPGDNLVHNPDFEATMMPEVPDGVGDDDTNWLTIFNNNTRPLTNPYEAGNFADAFVAQSGRNSLRVVMPGPWYDLGIMTGFPTGPIDNTTAYNVTFWVRVTAGSTIGEPSAPPTMKLSLRYGPLNSMLYYQTWSLSKYTPLTWTRVSTTVKPAVVGQLGLTWFNVGTVWIDNVFVSPLA